MKSTMPVSILAMVLAVLVGPFSGAQAATVDLTNEPLPTYVANKTKPNILFILDNSGSMGWDYMPDDVKDSASDYTNTYGYKSAHCNGVAFDPTYTYEPPVKADGKSYPPAVFTAAMANGFTPKPPTYGATYSSNSAQTTAVSGANKTFRFTDGFTFLGFGGAGLPSWPNGTTVSIEDPNDPNHWMIGKVEDTGSNQCAGLGLFGICLFGNSYRDVVIKVTQVNGTGATGPWGVTAFALDNLTGSTYYNYRYDLADAQIKMNWTYTASGVKDTTFKRECISHPNSISGEAGDGKFTPVVVTATSPEAQNFANWYQYYRTRMLMTRSGAGGAFQPLRNQYRIGFTTINDTDITESNSWANIQSGQAFLHVKDYDNNQRSAFLDRLYNTNASGGTPLRGALSKAGRYFAGKLSGQTAGTYTDPVQNACQRNYAFLSTDGYWTDTSNPKKLDGSTDIGQQDAADVRPFSDGGSSTSVTETKSIEHRETRTTATVTQKYKQSLYSNYVNGTFGQCFGQKKRTVVVRTATTSITGQRVETADWTTTTTVTSTTNAGVVTVGQPITSAAISSNVVTTDPVPPVPTSWTNGAPTTECVSGTSQPAAFPLLESDSKDGGTTVNLSGTPVTVALSTSSSGPTTTVTGGSGGVSNTLADVAQYYYKTDLRTSALNNCTAGAGGSGDVCDNTNVPASGRDTAKWQHMTTYTLGLGVNGTLAYDRHYLAKATDPASDYYKLINGPLNWPAPVVGNATTIDDLWHTAVNGRGEYFGAKNATDLKVALRAALAGMGQNLGASGRPTTTKNSAEDTQGLKFATSYLTGEWTGDLKAYTVLANGGEEPLPGTAQAGVDNLAWRNGRTSDARVIKYAQPGAVTPTLRDFTFTNLDADGLGANFTNFCSKTMSDTATVYPTQCAWLDADQVIAANSGENMVNYLRGHGAKEDNNAVSPLYRARLSALGDIVNSAPTYVKVPIFNYTDSGYAAFKTSKLSRKAMVYVGANDGMLHAFSADPTFPTDRGSEMWAFVPTAVMPKMARLANADYGNRHVYMADGSPNVSDVKINGVWRTILVAGLNGGGKSYYALDITDPLSPKLLWEYFETATATALSNKIPAAVKDADLGYTYGNPLVVKRADGKWVVVFASGYNNTGNGYLYVLDAADGRQLEKIPTNLTADTPAGTSVKPSGLSQIRAWTGSPADATAKRFYGGDLLGNLWRFDIDGLVEPKRKAHRLAVLQIDPNTPQAITRRPELALIRHETIDYPVVIVGTGRYLGASDLSATTKQALYAIKDPLTDSGWGDVRNTNGALVNKVVTTSTAIPPVRQIQSSTVNWASVAGWRMEFESSKERMHIDMQLTGTTLKVGTIVPDGSSLCAPSGGFGWKYTINIITGGMLPGATSAGAYMTSPLAGFGPGVGCNGNMCTDYTKQNGEGGSDEDGSDIPSGTVKRVLWRELIN